MKKVAVAVASIFTAMAPAAFAQWYQNDGRGYAESRAEIRSERYDRRDWRDRRDTARVIETKPVFRDGDERKVECWNTRTARYEEVRDENKHRVGKGAAIGAVAGGVLGHQVDQGGGTAAGAVVGGLLGHHLEGRRDRRQDQANLDMSRCRSWGGQEVQGYEVRYEYDGQEYVTTMDHDPGDTLRVGDHIRRDGAPWPERYVHTNPRGYSGG